MEHRSTVPAILVNALLVVPALSVGEIASRAIDSAFRANVSDRLLEWLASGSAAGTASILAISLLIGFAAGAASMWITSMIFRSANYQIVAYSVSCIYATLYAVVGFLVVATTQPDLTIVSALTSVAGMVAGLFSMNRRISSARSKRYAAAR